MLYLLSFLILRLVLKMRLHCSELFVTCRFAKYTADFAVLFATRHSSLLFKPFFRSFQNLRLNLTALSTESCHTQASFCLGAPFVHPQVLSQASRRQDLISSQQSFTYFLLKFVKVSQTHWIYSSLTSSPFTYHICLLWYVTCGRL